MYFEKVKDATINEHYLSSVGIFTAHLKYNSVSYLINL